MTFLKVNEICDLNTFVKPIESLLTQCSQVFVCKRKPAIDSKWGGGQCLQAKAFIKSAFYLVIIRRKALKSTPPKRIGQF